MNVYKFSCTFPPGLSYHVYSPRRDAAALACHCRSARSAARSSKWGDAVRVSPISGRVREPASGRFAVEVAPGDPFQVAVDRCPVGGAILFRAGTHEGTVIISKEVHVFGRNVAVLQGSLRRGVVFSISAAAATLDRLIVRGGRTRGKGSSPAILITAGAARLQDCDVTSLETCIEIGLGAGSDAAPLLLNCR